jgi:hypothetical protein
MEAVRIHQALRGADALKAEGTGGACCSKTFKLGSMFELGAFSGCSNSVQTSGGQTRAYIAELPFSPSKAGGTMAGIGCGGSRHPPGDKMACATAAIPPAAPVFGASAVGTSQAGSVGLSLVAGSMGRVFRDAL